MSMYYSTGVKMVDTGLMAVEVIDIYKPKLDGLDEQASTGGLLGGLFASTQLDVEAALGKDFALPALTKLAMDLSMEMDRWCELAWKAANQAEQRKRQ